MWEAASGDSVIGMAASSSMWDVDNADFNDEPLLGEERREFSSWFFRRSLLPLLVEAGIFFYKLFLMP